MKCSAILTVNEFWDPNIDSHPNCNHMTLLPCGPDTFTFSANTPCNHETLSVAIHAFLWFIHSFLMRTPVYMDVQFSGTWRFRSMCA